MFGEAGVDDFLRNAGACLAELWQRTKLGRQTEQDSFFLVP